MVLYYSATGNTEYIARELANRLDDECVNLLGAIKSHDNTPLYSEKPYVICAPVIVCEMPRFMSDWLKKQEFQGSRDVYFVFTSGGYCGISGVLSKSLMEKKGMACHGHAEFTMPRNYMANNSYPQLPEKEIRERILASTAQLEGVAQSIRTGGVLTARKVQLWETLVTVPFNPVWLKLKATSKDFYVTEGCIGCSKCEKLCPLNNISMKDNKPVWGNSCTHCMACIGNCPVEAIEYANITQTKEKYNFGKYRYVLEEKN